MVFKLIVTLIILHPVISMKVSERLALYESPDSRCIIAFNKIVGQEQVASSPVAGPTWQSFMFSVRRLNCTVQDHTLAFYRIPEKNGTYDGFVGLVHRHEVDFVVYTARPDSLPYEPAKPTPPFAPSDIVIMTGKAPAETLRYDLTKFLDLGLVVYTYLFVSLFFLVPILIAYADSKRSIRRQPRGFFSKYRSLCIEMLGLLIDQENFSPRTLAARVLVLSVSIYTLVAVQCYLMSTVGADLVVKREAPTVDSFDDLLDSDLMPMVIDNFFTYQILKESPVGSKQHQLWLRVQANMPQSTPKFQAETFWTIKDSYTTILKKLLAREAAFLGPGLMEVGAKVAICCSRSQPEFGISHAAGKLHYSIEGSSSYMLTGLFSHKIAPYTEKVLSHVLRAFFEAGLISAYTDLFKKNVAAFYPSLKYDIDTIACIEGHGRSNQEFSPLSLDRVIKLFIVWLIMLVGTFIVLLLERCFFSWTLEHGCKNRRRVKVTSCSAHGWKRLSLYSHRL